MTGKRTTRPGLPPSRYEGKFCTERDHAVRAKVEPGDDRLYRCDCGCVLVSGNGKVTIRPEVLQHRFPGGGW